MLTLDASPQHPQGLNVLTYNIMVLIIMCRALSPAVSALLFWSYVVMLETREKASFLGDSLCFAYSQLDGK